MWGRIVELAVDGRHARREHGLLVVSEGTTDRKEIARVPLSDVEAVVASGRGVTLSRGLLARLADDNRPVVIAGDNFQPVGVLMPLSGHHLQARRFDAQVSASLPAKKRVWTRLVKAKIIQQACVLAAAGKPDTRLLRLARDVKSGDPQNCEAQAARIYWKLLFGKGFSRDRAAPGRNGMLNYGYTVLRASTARAVAAAGLHPTLGVHHTNQANSMRLVDDLMEPYRPFVDLAVVGLEVAGHEDVTTDVKRALVDVLSLDLDVGDLGTSPVGLCLQRTASSLADLYLGERKDIWLPKPQVPSAAAVQLADC